MLIKFCYIVRHWNFIFKVGQNQQWLLFPIIRWSKTLVWKAAGDMCSFEESKVFQSKRTTKRNLRLYIYLNWPSMTDCNEKFFSQNLAGTGQTFFFSPPTLSSAHRHFSLSDTQTCSCTWPRRFGGTARRLQVSAVPCCSLLHRYHDVSSVLNLLVLSPFMTNVLIFLIKTRIRKRSPVRCPALCECGWRNVMSACSRAPVQRERGPVPMWQCHKSSWRASNKGG